MKIIVLSSCYPSKSQPFKGIFIHKTLKALSELGVEIHVIQPSNWFPPFGLHRLHVYWKRGFEASRDFLKELDGIKIHNPKVFIRLPSRLFRQNGWVREGLTISKFIKKKKALKGANLIFAQFLIHEGYVGTIVKNETELPLVSIALGDDVHAWPNEKPEYIPYIEEVLLKSDLVLANGEGLAKDTAKFAKSNTLAIKPIYRGVDLLNFCPPTKAEKFLAREVYSLSCDLKFLLCVATPVKLKGWYELLDSFKEALVTNQNWRLIIVAPRRKHTGTLDLEKEVTSRGLINYVKFFWEIMPDAMPKLMKAVDAFVLPSYNEGISNAVLESMASGLPTITTKVGGHAEVIEDGVSGLIVLPQDVQSLTIAINNVFSNLELRNYLGKNARKSTEKIGSFSENAKKLKEILKNQSRI